MNAIHQTARSDVGRTLFSALFLAYGVIVATVSDRLDRIEAS